MRGRASFNFTDLTFHERHGDMDRKNTTRLFTQRSQGLTIAGLTVVLAVSGCSQASWWMSRNKVEAPTALAEASANGDHAEIGEFEQVFEETPTLRSQFVPTGFAHTTDSANKGQHADSAARPLVPPANESATPPIPSEQQQHQLTNITTPRKALTTLAAGESLDEKLQNASGVVIVDFYADWCGPCRRQGIILHDAEAQAERNSATIVKVNVDQHHQLARKYQVTGLPTLVAIKDGVVVKRQVGLANSAAVASLLRL